MHAGVLPWQPWLECLRNNVHFGHACALSDSVLQQHEDPEQDLQWPVLRILLQRLFCKEGRVRHAAAKKLLVQVAGGSGLLDDAAIEGVGLCSFAAR